jgi:hypothetical protein
MYFVRGKVKSIFDKTANTKYTLYGEEKGYKDLFQIRPQNLVAIIWGRNEL